MGNTIVGCALLLGILIFLPEPTGGTRDYGHPCTNNSQCKTKACNLKTNKCECPTVLGKLVQYFHTEQQCLSAVGAVCTHKSLGHDLLEIHCVPNAVCLKSDPHLPNNWGRCHCDRTKYEETRDHLCETLEMRSTAEGYQTNNHIIIPEGDKDRWISPSLSSTQNGSLLFCVLCIILSLHIR